MKGKKKYSLGKKIAVFLLLFGSVNASISLFYYKKVAPKNSLFQTDIRYGKNIKNSKMLFLGHSRALMGLADSLFENSFNYASYGENNIYTYYKIKQLLADPQNEIETIIIPYGFGTFSSLNNPYIFDHSYWSKYIDYIELGRKHNELEKYISLKFQSELFPYNRFLQRKINKKFKFFKSKKSALQEMETKAEKTLYAYNAIKVNFVNRNCYDQISYEYLQKTLAICKSKNVKVIAIKYPLTRYYYEAYNKIILEEVWNISSFEKLLIDYKVELINFEKLYFERDDLFKDTHHLNENGRGEFSLIVKQKLATLKK